MEALVSKRRQQTEGKEEAEPGEGVEVEEGGRPDSRARAEEVVPHS